MTTSRNDAVYLSSNDGALYTSFSSETQLAEKDALKLLRQQYKLKCLHHAWACQYYPGEDATCPDFQHCCAAKRLYQHVIQCRHVPASSIVDSNSNNKCPVPGCRKMRRVWAHYKRCSMHDCVLCSIVPRHRMNVVIENESPNRPRNPPLLIRRPLPPSSPFSPIRTSANRRDQSSNRRLLPPLSPKRTSVDRGDYRYDYR